MGSNGGYGIGTASIDSSSQPPNPLPMQPQNKQHTPTRVTAFSSSPHPPPPLGNLSVSHTSLLPSPPPLPPGLGTASAHAPRSFTKFPSLSFTSRQSWTLDVSSPGTLVPSWPSNRMPHQICPPERKGFPFELPHHQNID
ncbi:hypothetical protein CGRA01v4_08914 [Colletotrichum graminicola]|nr:hypothetical protein CGRA01v4_08914 [Colletotrichum graminicola]